MYKLINNYPVKAPGIINSNGTIYDYPDDDTLRSLGYKNLLNYSGPETKWYQQEKLVYQEDEINIFPTKEFSPAYGLKDLYYKKQNDICDYSIVSGFKWVDDDNKEHTIWLDMINQFNFTSGSFPCEFKLNYEDWHTFISEAELTRFKSEAKAHVEKCLKICWDAKKIAKDFTEEELYNYLIINDIN